MDTMLLDTAQWDLITDAQGNWAVASNPYSEAQDVASAIKLFLGEAYFDVSQGIPYFGQIFGVRPNLQFVKSQIEAAALTVPGVVKALCLFASFDNRNLTGQVQIIDQAGVQNNVTF